MKYIGLILLIAVVCSSAADGDVLETDELRISNPDQVVNSHQLRMALKQAKLEEHGFNITVQYVLESDENGILSRRKKTVSYIVRDYCSKAQTWQERLEKLLPNNFFAPKVSTTFAREIQKRTLGRSTKYCQIGLEVTSFIKDKPKLSALRRPKRSSPEDTIIIIIIVTDKKADK